MINETLIILIAILVVAVFSFSYHFSKKQFRLLVFMIKKIRKKQYEYISIKVQNLLIKKLSSLAGEGFESFLNLKTTLKTMSTWKFKKIPGSEQIVMRITLKYKDELDFIIEDIKDQTLDQKELVLKEFIERLMGEFQNDFMTVLEKEDPMIRYVFENENDVIRSVFQESSTSMFFKFLKNNITSHKEQVRVLSSYVKDFDNYIISLQNY
jgi:hypothetical protein